MFVPASDGLVTGVEEVDDQLKVAYQLLAPSTRIGRDASTRLYRRDY